MNTLSNSGSFLEEDGYVMFLNKNIDFGFPKEQRMEILRLWKEGKGVNFISKKVKRNVHEVRLTLYEFWMERRIKDISRAFVQPNTLMVSGREQLRRQSS